MKKIYIIVAIIISIIIASSILIVNLNRTNENSKEIIIKGKCNNPIIPYGFKKIETTTASWELDEQGNPKGWNEGLVIEDETGNQFVWVPLKKLPTDDFNNQDILRYSGFYIARYEAGLPLDTQKVNLSESTNNVKGTPVSKEGAIPWNYININNAMYNAEHMYTENPYFKTTLMDSNAYYITFFFLGDFSSRKNYSNISSNMFKFTGYYSTDEGKNYTYGENMEKNSDMLLSTGATDKTKLKNIYDFFGNLSDSHITNISEFSYIYAEANGDNYKMNLEHYYNNMPYYNPSPIIGYRVILYMY